MFGFVIADLQKLSDEDSKIYKGAYCGLCHSLGDRHGTACRATLNYDMAFLTLLLSAVYGIEFEELSRKCPAHPTKRLPCQINEITAYAADMNIALTMQSSLDKWNDDKSLYGLCTSKFMTREYTRVKSKYPRQCSMIEKSLSELSSLEKSGSTDADAVSRCFGRLLSEVFIWQEDALTARLRAFGYELGQVIYIMDASVDLKSDLKKKRYNPLVFMTEVDHREIISSLMSRTLDAYNKLNICKYKDIFDNIMYSGIWTRYDIAKRKGEKVGGK